jgi:uncharacterized protein YdaU (DUF1376 family)
MIADLAMPVQAAVVLSETAELAAEEFGAYQRLLCHMWVRGGALPLPAAPGESGALARLAGCDIEQWPRIWQAIGHLFEESPRGLTQPALSEALVAAEAERDERLARGRALTAARKPRGPSGGGTQRPVERVVEQPVARSNGHDGEPVVTRTVELTVSREGKNGGFGGSGSDLLSPSLEESGSGKDRVGRFASDIRAVFAHYRQWHPRAMVTPRPESKEWRSIAARLREGATVEDLCKAIDGYHRDPWHCGENDRNKAYLDLSLIMRDGTHVQRGLEYADDPKIGLVVSVKERRSMRAAANFVARHTEAPELPSWMQGITKLSQTG